MPSADDAIDEELELSLGEGAKAHVVPEFVHTLPFTAANLVPSAELQTAVQDEAGAALEIQVKPELVEV